MMMCAYPQYTVDRLRQELTHKQVMRLMACWKDFPPPYMDGRMIRMALFGILGVKGPDDDAGKDPEQVLRERYAAFASAGIPVHGG